MKKYLSASVRALSLSVQTHLTNRAECQTDQIAKKTLHNPSFATFSEPFINKGRSVEIGEGKITKGQGEYVVFHELQIGKREPLSFETFE